MQSVRIRRLVRLMQTMQSDRAFDADTLASELGVSRRTLFRDLNVLDDAGVPHRFDKRVHRYRLDRSHFLPPINLTLGEALAIMLVTRKVMNHRMIPTYRPAVHAAAKIECVLPRQVREHCGQLLEGVDVRFWPTSDVQGASDALATIQQCLAVRQKVRLRYDSYFEGEVIDVVLRPYRVLFARRAWYVIGFSEKHSQVRTFKIERIEKIDVLDETYELDRAFRLDDYLGNAWQMIRGDRPYHVVIRFLPQMAGNVDEVAWHKTQRTSRDDDGSLIFEADVDGIDEITWWVLGYGDQAIVLEPPELRERIAAHARGMLAHYERSQDAGAKG